MLVRVTCRKCKVVNILQAEEFWWSIRTMGPKYYTKVHVFWLTILRLQPFFKFCLLYKLYYGLCPVLVFLKLRDIAVVPFFHSQVTVVICYHPDDDVCFLWWDVINPTSDSLVMTIQAQGPSDGLKNTCSGIPLPYRVHDPSPSGNSDLGHSFLKTQNWNF